MEKPAMNKKKVIRRIITLLLIVQYFGLTEALDFQVWKLAKYIRDGISSSGRISSTKQTSAARCVAECTQDPDCVMIGFSESRNVCDQYETILTVASTLADQDSTMFYKSATTCTEQNYTYVPDLNLCLKVFMDAATYTAARASCQLDGGDLIMVKTEGIALYLKTILEVDVHFWIGLKQTPGMASSWFWVDESPLNVILNWFPGEPNNVAEECVEMILDGGLELVFNDIICSVPTNYICQIF